MLQECIDFLKIARERVESVAPVPSVAPSYAFLEGILRVKNELREVAKKYYQKTYKNIKKYKNKYE